MPQGTMAANLSIASRGDQFLVRTDDRVTLPRSSDRHCRGDHQSGVAHGAGLMPISRFFMLLKPWQ